MKKIFIIIPFIFINTFLFSGESRDFDPILINNKKETTQRIIFNIPQYLIKKNVKIIFKNWKRGNIEKFISEDFYDRDKFLDAIVYMVPVDAKLRDLAIKRTVILNQKSNIKKDGKIELESLISTTAVTQIEFNDPLKGFRKLEGENEYLIKIKARLIPLK